MKAPTTTENLLAKRTRPNYEAVRDLVYYVHKYLCKHELPIDLSFMYKFDNLKIKTYSWFANLNRLSIEQTIEYLNSNSGCCYYMVDTKRYLILYNDLIENECHNRWTLAHELGHYLLKHNEICTTAIISRNSLSKSEYDIYEKEANAFARELLAPLNVLCCISDKYVTLSQIMEMCDLSYEAANNIINFANAGSQMGISYFCKSKTTELFKKFIKNYKCLNSCINCKYTFSSVDANFCPICGSNELIKGALKDKMKYESNYHLNENGRINECPVCHNEEITDGEYCKICGTFLINKCTNILYDNWGNQIDGCGKIAEANARYCIYCGEKTTFFENGLLCDYTKYTPTSNFHSLSKLWESILSDLRADRKMMLSANLMNTELFEIDTNTLSIYFPNGLTPFTKTLITKKENFTLLKERISKKLGRDINIILTDKNVEAS